MNKKLAGIIAVVVVLFIGLVVVSSGSSSTGNSSSDEKAQTSNSEASNTTDMEALKSSEYSSEEFDNVNLGDSKSDVEKSMGQLEEVGESQEGYDVYSVTDDTTIYYFFFDGDKLVESSLVLNS